MNFLRQHFEKLGLGFVLTVLVASIVLVMFSMGKARGEATEQKEAAEAALKAGKDIEAAASPTIDELIDILRSEKNVFDCIGGEGKTGGSLLEPVGYMSCVSPKCIYLIDHDAQKCPFCGAEQPPEKKDSFPLEEDADRDGVPNYVEDNTFFLDSKDPKDAGLDVDGDGFTNVEEYRADTNMASGASCPPLALNLRIMGEPSFMPMPIAVKRVLASGAEDPKEWRVVIAVLVAGQARPVMGRFKIGGVIRRFGYGGQRYGPFKIEKIVAKPGTAEGETEAKGGYVVTISSEGKTYEATEGENFPEAEPSAKLVFLGTRLKKQREIIEKKMWIVGKKDHLFQLTNYAVNRSERYKINEFTKDTVVVELQQGRGDGNMEGDGGMPMEGGGVGPGGMQGDGREMQPGGGGMRPGVGGMVPGVPEREPQPVVFTITKKYDAERDLLDEPPRPARRPGAPRGMPGEGRR